MSIRAKIEITGDTFEDILHGMRMVRLGMRKNWAGADAHRRCGYSWTMEPDLNTEITRLRTAIAAFLFKHQVGTDTNFYTQAEWAAKNEEYLRNAPLVMTFEGTFNHIMNLHPVPGYVAIYNEFDQLCRGMGWYFELGNHWNAGFYRLPPRPHAEQAPTVDTVSDSNPSHPTDANDAGQLPQSEGGVPQSAVGDPASLPG